MSKNVRALLVGGFVGTLACTSPAPNSEAQSSSEAEASAKPPPKPAAPEPAAPEPTAPAPATPQAAAGPLAKDPLRLGHGERGTVSVQIRDLSTDELAQLQLLESSHGTGVIPAKTEGLPSRFSIGDSPTPA